MTIEEEREQADRERLEKMTVKELRVIAKEEFCTLGRNRSRKADLSLSGNGSREHTSERVGTNDLPKMSQ